MMSSSSPHIKPKLSYTSYTDAPNYGFYRNVGFAAQRLIDIVNAVRFEGWPQFDVLARKARNQFKALSSDQHDVLTSCVKPSDEFDLEVPTILELLSKIAVRDDTELSSNLRILAGEPGLTYGRKGGSHRLLHDIGIFTNTYSENVPPDTGVRATSAWSDGEKLRPFEDVSESLASAYNRYFISYQERNKDSDVSDDCLLNQISEIILTALHTRSGWYCLYREEEAVFLQVDTSQVSKTRWLTVRVSDIYKHDGIVSTLHGLLALFQACKVAEDTKQEQLSDTATRLMMCTAKRYDEATQDVGVNSSSPIFARYKPGDQLTLTSSQRARQQSAIRGEALLVLNEGELARFFLVNCGGYLGCGSSGYVVRSCVEGVDFVVKRWSRYEWDIHNAGDRLLDLLYESPNH